MSYHPLETGAPSKRREPQSWRSEPNVTLALGEAAVAEDGPATDQHDISDILGETMGRRPERNANPFAPTEPPVDDEPIHGPLLDSSDPIAGAGAAGAADEGEDLLDAQTTRVDAHPDPIAREQEGAPRLVVIGGADRGKEFNLRRGENSIGRGLENDVVLADIAVSRRHTLVTHDGARFVMTDLGSGNGTLVNGERVDTHLLRGGDQIELGNTLLRFVSPGDPSAALGEAETQVGEIVGERRLLAEAAPTAQELDLGAPAPRTERRRERLPRPAKVLLFGVAALVLFLGVAVLVKVLLVRRQKSSETDGPASAQAMKTSAAAASMHFDRGRRYLRARVWESARDEFEKVYALAPQFEHVKRYIRQTKVEMYAERDLLQARLGLERGAFDEARGKLAEIPATSVYAVEVPKLKAQIDAAQIELLLEAVREQREKGNVADARAAIAQALRIAPTNAEVQRLHEELSKTVEKSARVTRASAETVTQAEDPGRARRGSARPPTRAPEQGKSEIARKREAPVPRGSTRRLLKEALSLYEKMEWDGAADAVEAQLATVRPDTLRTKLAAQAKAMRRVGDAYRAALASQTRSPAQAIRHYQLALKEDEKASGGAHRKVFEERLFKVARVQAISSLSTGHDSAAYDAIKLARRYGPVDAQLTSVQKTLEKRAMELFTKAYTIRTRNAAEAQRIWQRVLRMVPPESQAYQKAYKWLNSSAPDELDEDEY